MMKYSGKLYGKVGRKYIPLKHDTDYVENLEAEIERVNIANLDLNHGINTATHLQCKARIKELEHQNKSLKWDIDILKQELESESKWAEKYKKDSDEHKYNFISTRKLCEKYFNENIKFKNALKKIANLDYRGNKSPEMNIAEKALKQKD